MKGKILIVDDEESLRFTFESFLEGEGHEVATAGNYEKALEALRQTDYDVVFADILLGGKTGLDLLRQLRALDRLCPVIMFTGYPNVETAAEAVRLGAFDYLTKPVRKADLLQLASRALEHWSSTRQEEEKRANLKAIFGSVEEGIITVDPQGRLIEVNEAAKKICELTDADIGGPFAEAGRNCSGLCRETLMTTLRQKEPTAAGRIECRQGRSVSLAASTLQDEEGAFAGAVLMARSEACAAEPERRSGNRHQFYNMVGKSEGMQQVYALVRDLAGVPTTALVTGESGTGKELVAEALHYLGDRKKEPLVRVNCAALPDELLASELFGHVRGAFTGAIKDRQGRLKKADGGTLFLDEIGDISPRMQLSLLRVLQDKEFERVGDSTPTRVDVRIVAATNQDLAERVRRGDFREDLFYRLKVVNVHLPPLRQRKGDLPLLTRYFIDKLNRTLKKEITGCTDEVAECFAKYPWPGNVREFQHVLEHAFVRCHGSIIDLPHLPPEIKGPAGAGTLSSRSSEEEEVSLILEALKKTDSNKAKAARLLGIDRKTLYRKIEKHGITPP